MLDNEIGEVVISAFISIRNSNIGLLYIIKEVSFLKINQNPIIQ